MRSVESHPAARLAPAIACPVEPSHLDAVQINGSITPISGLTLASLDVSVAPGAMTANATGSLSGTPVAVELSSTVQEGDTSVRVGSIRVSSSLGASLSSLVSSQASQVSSDIGIDVLPAMPADDTTGSTSAAELVFDSRHGLRMVNISLASAARMRLTDLAGLVGFPYDSSADAGSDPISFSAPWLYYVPSKPNATNITWAGRQLVGPELGVAATVDVPALGINATRGTLLVQGRNKLSLLVSHLAYPCYAKACLLSTLGYGQKQPIAWHAKIIQ
jgi:hypothetical protein